MLNRVKRALVDSYIGAIALGYLLAEAILYFVSIFTAPVGGMIAQNENRRTLPGVNLPSHSPAEYAIPRLVAFFVLLVVWYFLLRWLYLTPLKTEAAPPSAELQAD